MIVWLITSGEVLPKDGERPHRAGMLSQVLESRGHCLTWWTTSFDHQSKSYIYNKDTLVKLSERYHQIFLHSRWTYSKNISLGRIMNHWEVGKKFHEISKNQVTPDIILCSFPTIDLSYWSVKYAVSKGIPVIADIRDLWPDIITNNFSSYLRPIAKAVLNRYYQKTRYIFTHCSAITAVSEDYLKWGLKYSERIQGKTDVVFPLGYYEHDQLAIVEETRDAYYREIGLTPNKIILWFVGTFGKTYDMTTVLEAIKGLTSTSSLDIQLVISGDGERNLEWTRAASALDNVIFTGWVNAQQLKYLSNVADIGLMAYQKNAPQGLPNKIYEYMASGLAILSSLQTETKEILDKYRLGYTFEAGNVEDCKRMISKIINNEDDLIKMKARSRELFQRKYLSSKIYNAFVTYLEAAVK